MSASMGAGRGDINRLIADAALFAVCLVQPAGERAKAPGLLLLDAKQCAMHIKTAMSEAPTLPRPNPRRRPMHLHRLPPLDIKRTTPLPRPHRRRNPLPPIPARNRLVTTPPIHPPDTLHRKRTRRRPIQHRQLLGAQPPRQQHRPRRDQRQDKHGEPHGRHRLRDGKRGPEPDELEPHKQPQRAAAREPRAAQRVRRGRQGAVAREEDELGGYAVRGEGLDAHDEEEAGEDGLREEAEGGEERGRHGAESEEALEEVGGALLDDVGGAEDEARVGGGGGVVVVFGRGVRDVRGDAEGLGVEGGLGDEAVGEGEAEEAGDARGEAEEEDVPVEAGGLAEGEFGALGDEGGDWGGD